MEEIPESGFGPRDYLVIFLTVITGIVMYLVIPEQRWITESEVGLLVSRVIIAIIMSAVAWVFYGKWIIPSDAELIDLDVKRRIIRGMDDIEEDADEILKAGKRIGLGYQEKVIALGRTLRRIHQNLKGPDLQTLAEIEGKLFRFVALLNGFLPYTLDMNDREYKRTTREKFETMRRNFEKTLDETVTAFDNLEEGLTGNDASEIEVLSQTLHDLYSIDGLLTSKERKKQIGEIKRRAG